MHVCVCLERERENELNRVRLRRFFAFAAQLEWRNKVLESVLERSAERRRERERERERAQSASFGGRTFGVPRFVSGDPG